MTILERRPELFVPGRKLRVFHQAPSQRWLHESVLRYLGARGEPLELLFDARPVGDLVAIIPASWIIGIEPAEDDA